MYTEFKENDTKSPASFSSFHMGFLHIDSRETYAEEGRRKIRRDFFWPPFSFQSQILWFVSIMSNLPEKGGWGAGGYSGAAAGHAGPEGGRGALLPHLLCCDTLSRDPSPSETRPLGQCSCQRLAWPFFPPFLPGVATEPRGLGPQFLELLQLQNLVSTHSPTLSSCHRSEHPQAPPPLSCSLLTSSWAASLPVPCSSAPEMQPFTCPGPQSSVSAFLHTNPHRHLLQATVHGPPLPSLS